jgi:hypothetical protein
LIGPRNEMFWSALRQEVLTRAQFVQLALNPNPAKSGTPK